MIRIRTARLQIPGVRPRRFLHLSDVHLSQSYPNDPPEAAAFALTEAARWTVDGLTPREFFRNFLEETEKMRPDALILTGDGVDYYNTSNLRYLTEQVRGLNTRFFYVHGNHEGMVAPDFAVPAGRPFYPAYRELMGDDPSFRVWDLGDLLLIGLDDGEREITVRQNALLAEQLERGIPTLILMHIPVRLPPLKEIVEREYPRSGVNYFLLGNPDHSEQVHKFCRTLADPTMPIAAILSGHIHWVTDYELAPGRKQYTAAPGVGWDIRINMD